MIIPTAVPQLKFLSGPNHIWQDSTPAKKNFKLLYYFLLFVFFNLNLYFYRPLIFLFINPAFKVYVFIQKNSFEGLIVTTTVLAKDEKRRSFQCQKNVLKPNKWPQVMPQKSYDFLIKNFLQSIR